MNRKYSINEFEDIVTLLRNNFPNVSLTTDIIVGFPGETEEEFEKTYKFLEKIKFSKMHVFKYSRRKGTVADKMPNQIDGNIKEQRSAKLIELSNKNEKEFLNRFIGKNIDVLFEEKDGKYVKGHTSNYIVVKAEKENIENKLLEVNIVKEENLELIGKPV